MPNGDRTWSGLNVPATSANIIIGGGGGGAGGYYSGGGITSGGQFITTTTGTVTPFASQPNPMDFLMKGPNKLTPDQLALLLREHTFIEMRNSAYCLFCYALDQYRDRGDHLFVISEE